MTAKCCQAFTSSYELGIFLGIDLIFIGPDWLTIELAGLPALLLLLLKASNNLDAISDM
jgi:hypothetical protein